MDTCIAIRIVYKKNGKVFVRSGAGIVADSVPEKEYEECYNKAKASLRALELAEELDSSREDEALSRRYQDELPGKSSNGLTKGVQG